MLNLIKPAAVLGVIGLGTVALAGCTQISALKQVSGVPMTSLTIAANDVLVEKKIAILKAPVCQLANAVYTCAGTTVTKEPIEVTAPDTEKLVMTVKVNNAVIFTGAVQEVIDKAQQGGAP